ncbi:MAG: U32 family peptidase [Bacteroidales bacterium]|jgi:putative protease|nr:U32 family peptidase [Bacteroidales bacterium]MEE1021037.1 U32 family peptidase [Bacteroidales bacterium]MEE1225806.1 U32 family peptidase [Bacteroidales bacterium]
MTKNKVEIMSPVGSYEALYAAIEAGADSVYFGVEGLNMRSRSANNFTIEDLKNIADIASQNGVKTYLTLNTIVYDSELGYMQEILNAAKQSGVSAVIAADLAVISYARSINLEVHLSTQCNITNREAVKFFSQFADVIVTARELSLDKVKDITTWIRENNIKGPSGRTLEIECFVHGALCMAVSGKCYISLDNANQSANRGACLQFCRRPYKVTDLDGGTELMIDNQYIMSPKDLKTLNFLDKVLDAGVRVLKIEGRGRSPEYVKVVTRVYKEAAQAWLNGEWSEDKLEKWNEDLKKVYNRGFWDGYYLGQRVGEWTKKYGSQATTKKTFIGTVTNYFKNISVAEIKIETGELKVGDNIYIMGTTTGVYEDTVEEIRVDLKPTEKTVKGEFCSIATKGVVRRGDKLYLVESTGIC